MPDCPVGGTCSQKWVVYSARVTPSNGGKVETYTGLTYRPFKTRWKEHLVNDFENPKCRTKSNLSGHIWDLKDRGRGFDDKWSIIEQPKSAYYALKKNIILCMIG